MADVLGRAYSRVLHKNWKVVVKNLDVDVEVQKVLQLFDEEHSPQSFQAVIS